MRSTVVEPTSTKLPQRRGSGFPRRAVQLRLQTVSGVGGLERFEEPALRLGGRSIPPAREADLRSGDSNIDAEVLLAGSLVMRLAKLRDAHAAGNSGSFVPQGERDALFLSQRGAARAAR